MSFFYPFEKEGFWIAKQIAALSELRSLLTQKMSQEPFVFPNL